MAHLEHHGNGSGHEHREANVRIIIETVIGLVIAVTVICVFIWGLFNLYKHNAGGSAQRLNAMAAPSQLPPGPRLQVKPYEELQALRKREEEVLNSYGWVDQRNGIVHIPIDQAMDQVVSKLPVRAQGGQNAPAK